MVLINITNDAHPSSGTVVNRTSAFKDSTSDSNTSYEIGKRAYKAISDIGNSHDKLINKKRLSSYGFEFNHVGYGGLGPGIYGQRVPYMFFIEILKI